MWTPLFNFSEPDSKQITQQRPPDSPQHLLHQSFPHLCLHVQAVSFLPFLFSSVPHPPIFFLLFCVIKFEQRKVDCLSVLHNKSIIPLSLRHTADNALRLVKGRPQREKHFWTYHSTYCQILICLSSFDLVSFPLNLYCVLFLGSCTQACLDAYQLSPADTPHFFSYNTWFLSVGELQICALYGTCDLHEWKCILI